MNMLEGRELELLDKAIKQHNGVWGGRDGKGDCLITSGRLNVFFAVGEEFDFVDKGNYMKGYWDYLCSKDQWLQRAKELGYPKGEGVTSETRVSEDGKWVVREGDYVVHAKMTTEQLDEWVAAAQACGFNSDYFNPEDWPLTCAKDTGKLDSCGLVFKWVKTDTTKEFLEFLTAQEADTHLEVSYTPHLGRWWKGAKLLAEENGFVVFTREGRDKPLIRKRGDVLFRDPPTELDELVEEALKEMGYYTSEDNTPEVAVWGAVYEMIELGYRKGAK